MGSDELKVGRPWAWGEEDLTMLIRVLGPVGVIELGVHKTHRAEGVVQVSFMPKGNLYHT